MSEEENINREPAGDNREISDETISSVEPVAEAETQPSTLNIQPSTSEEMEVHHHTHPGHGKKTWKDYFWEFLMLFLAVFCGFLAEYQLEHTIEHQREKQYMKSMAEDVIRDSAMLTSTVQRAMFVVNHIDTVLDIIQNKKIDDNSLYTLYRVNLKSLAFFGTSFTDRTTVQLKNSGTMRLIHEATVADAIIDYWNKTELVVKSNDLLEDYKIRARDKSYSIFNQKYYINSSSIVQVNETAPKLMTSDLFQLEEYSNRLSHIRNIIVNVYLPLLKTQQETAKKLIALIKKEYHLENE